MANVEIYQSGQFTIAKSGGKQIAACQIKGNARSLFKAAIDAVPNGGSLNIGKGRYVFSAPYALPLNPDGSNIFYFKNILHRIPSLFSVLMRLRFGIYGSYHSFVINC